jgi:GAF domain-containing protein
VDPLSPTELASVLSPIADRLRAATAASRTTVRVTDSSGEPALAAESLADGVGSMRDGPQPAVSAAPTYTELERTRTIIVQDDCRTEGPRPPAALIEHYRVYAQMLAPVFAGDAMIATISVHQQDSPRPWTPAEVAALRQAQLEVLAALASGQS